MKALSIRLISRRAQTHRAWLWRRREARGLHRGFRQIPAAAHERHPSAARRHPTPARADAAAAQGAEAAARPGRLHRAAPPDRLAGDDQPGHCSLCHTHANQILRALQIAGMAIRIGAWRYIPQSSGEKGAQIDLFFDRADRVITLCEIKYSQNPIVADKSSPKVSRCVPQSSRLEQAQTRHSTTFSLHRTALRTAHWPDGPSRRHYRRSPPHGRSAEFAADRRRSAR